MSTDVIKLSAKVLTDECWASAIGTRAVERALGEHGRLDGLAQYGPVDAGAQQLAGNTGNRLDVGAHAGRGTLTATKPLRYRSARYRLLGALHENAPKLSA